MEARARVGVRWVKHGTARPLNKPRKEMETEETKPTEDSRPSKKSFLTEPWAKVIAAIIGAIALVITTWMVKPDSTSENKITAPSENEEVRSPNEVEVSFFVEINGAQYKVTEQDVGALILKARRLLIDGQSRTQDNREISRLAAEFGLFEKTNINPDLAYKSGDIGYWAGQNKTRRDLVLEFASRRLILDIADREGIEIPKMGDLSFWAELARPDLERVVEQ